MTDTSTTRLRKLSGYAQSLLKVDVAVVVTLASKKESVSCIVDLTPGGIIQFDKSCDEMLDLEISDQAIAVGEAVKVGDKFGLRITSMVLPDEQFKIVQQAIDEASP